MSSENQMPLHDNLYLTACLASPKMTTDEVQEEAVSALAAFASDGTSLSHTATAEEPSNCEEGMRGAVTIAMDAQAAPNGDESAGAEVPSSIPDASRDETDKPDKNGLVWFTTTFTVDPARYVSPNYRPLDNVQKNLKDVAKAKPDKQKGMTSPEEAEKEAQDSAPEKAVLDYATFIDGSSFMCFDDVGGVDYTKIAMDAGAKKPVTRATCQTTFAQCRAENPLYCRFHGPKLLEADIRTQLKKVVGKGVAINVSKDKASKNNTTFRLTVGCLPWQKKVVLEAVEQYLHGHPGITAAENKMTPLGKISGKDTMTQEFDMDILQADKPPKKDHHDTLAAVGKYLTDKYKAQNKVQPVVGETPAKIEKLVNGGQPEEVTEASGEASSDKGSKEEANKEVEEVQEAASETQSITAQPSDLSEENDGKGEVAEEEKSAPSEETKGEETPQEASHETQKEGGSGETPIPLFADPTEQQDGKSKNDKEAKALAKEFGIPVEKILEAQKKGEKERQEDLQSEDINKRHDGIKHAYDAIMKSYGWADKKGWVITDSDDDLVLFSFDDSMTDDDKKKVENTANTYFNNFKYRASLEKGKLKIKRDESLKPQTRPEQPSGTDKDDAVSTSGEREAPSPETGANEGEVGGASSDKKESAVDEAKRDDALPLAEGILSPIAKTEPEVVKSAQAATDYLRNPADAATASAASAVVSAASNLVPIVKDEEALKAVKKEKSRKTSSLGNALVDSALSDISAALEKGKADVAHKEKDFRVAKDAHSEKVEKASKGRNVASIHDAIASLAKKVFGDGKQSDTVGEVAEKMMADVGRAGAAAGLSDERVEDIMADASIASYKALLVDSVTKMEEALDATKEAVNKKGADYHEEDASHLARKAVRAIAAVETAYDRFSASVDYARGAIENERKVAEGKKALGEGGGGASTTPVDDRISKVYAEWVEEPIPDWVSGLSAAEKDSYAQLLEDAQNGSGSEAGAEALQRLLDFEDEHSKAPAKEKKEPATPKKAEEPKGKVGQNVAKPKEGNKSPEGKKADGGESKATTSPASSASDKEAIAAAKRLGLDAYKEAAELKRIVEQTRDHAQGNPRLEQRIKDIETILADRERKRNMPIREGGAWVGDESPNPNGEGRLERNTNIVLQAFINALEGK